VIKRMTIRYTNQTNKQSVNPMSEIKYTIRISGKADSFLRGTGLAQGKPDDDAGSLALADAYRKRVTTRRGKGYTVRLDIVGADGVVALAEYMDAGYWANAECDYSEAKACAKVVDACRVILPANEKGRLSAFITCVIHPF
jgi:hypothetical protein